MKRTTFCLVKRGTRWDQGVARPHHLLPHFEIGRRGAMRSVAKASSEDQEIFGRCRDLFRWESHQGDGHGYALHPVQWQCRRTTKVPAVVQCRSLYQWKHWRCLLMKVTTLQRSTYICIPHINSCRAPPSACQYAEGLPPLPLQWQEGGETERIFIDKLYYCFALFFLPSLEKHKTSFGVLTTIEFKSPVSWQNPENSFLFFRDGGKKKYSEAVIHIVHQNGLDIFHTKTNLNECHLHYI
jgi:hypothetical protein